MQEIKLFDSERKLMEILWKNGPLEAKEVCRLAGDAIGWNKNTTYTILKKLVEKGALRRDEPRFLCTPLVDKEEVRLAETRSLIDRLYDGSRKAFFASFLQQENLTREELDQLRDMIDKKD